MFKHPFPDSEPVVHPWRRESALAALLVLIAPASILAFTGIEIIDNAYISYRYTANFVLQRGLVFNAGEPVEGMTNLLWTILLALPVALGFDVAMAAAGLGVLFGLLAVADTWRICRSLGVSQSRATIVVLILAWYPGFWLTVANGLEAGLLAFLLTRTVYLVLVQRFLVGAGLAGGLLFLTRPDTAVVIPLCVLYLTVINRARSGRRRIVRDCVLPILTPWLATVVLVTLWRLLYYDAWYPNTIVAKSPGLFTLAILRRNMESGLHYVWGFLVSIAPLTIGALIALLRLPRASPTLFLFALLAAQIPVILINGGDWMGYYRLLVPYAPLLAVLSGMALEHLTAYRPFTTDRRSQSVAGTIVLLGSAALVLGLPGYPWDMGPRLEVRPSEGCYAELIHLLRPAILPSDRITAEALGLFGYSFLDNYTHDMLGLTDRHVAREGTIYYPQYGKAHPTYTYHTIRPDLILVHSGLGHLKPMARASSGRYNEEYATYHLQNLSCQTKTFMLSLRREHVRRFSGVLGELNGRTTLVPEE